MALSVVKFVHDSFIYHSEKHDKAQIFTGIFINIISFLPLDLSALRTLDNGELIRHTQPKKISG
jgi:hypothetical protein